MDIYFHFCFDVQIIILTFTFIIVLPDILSALRIFGWDIYVSYGTKVAEKVLRSVHVLCKLMRGQGVYLNKTHASKSPYISRGVYDTIHITLFLKNLRKRF